MTQPTRILMVTPLDYDGYRNTEHGMAHGFRAHGCELTIVYKRMNRSPKLLHMLRDTVLLRVNRRRTDEADLICVDPFFNYYAGLKVQADTAAKNAPKPKFSLKHLVIRMLSPLSVLRDVMFLPSFLLGTAGRLRGRYDLVIGYGPWGGLAAWAMWKLGRAQRFVYEDRDFEPGLVPDRLRQSYTAALERFLVTRADTVISIGHRLARLRESQLKQAGKDASVDVIPTGTYWDHFAPSRAVNRAARNGHTMVYVGNLISWSGLEVAIEGLAQIRQTFPAARLLVAGDGLPSYRQKLADLVTRLNLTDAVTFVGSVNYEGLPALLAQADLGLANSQPVEYRKFACPLKVIEYMAAGVPTVATADTEAAEIVERHDTGIATAFDAAAFAHAVTELWNDPARVARMVDRCDAVSRTYDWVALVERQLQIMLPHAHVERREALAADV